MASKESKTNNILDKISQNIEKQPLNLIQRALGIAKRKELNKNNTCAPKTAENNQLISKNNQKSDMENQCNDVNENNYSIKVQVILLI